MNALWNTKCPQSYRIASTPKTDYHFLHKDINVNVAIAGGGITGITAAYMLKKQGVTVAVIEAGRILQGTTGNTTAKLTSQHSLIYDKIKRYMGKEKARQYAEANETAIRTVEHIIKSEGIAIFIGSRHIHLPLWIHISRKLLMRPVLQQAWE